MKNMMNTKNLLSLAVGLGVAYYFFVVRPRKKTDEPSTETTGIDE
jgi:hypothetical protein